MGTIGRFADLSPSKFNPLSLDEIMAVPLYKQQQHDKLAADRENLYKSLVIDPLDVHKDEASRIKKEFEAKIDQQALQLAKYGIDQNSKSQFLKTKREYDQMVAPTGRVGQINNAKQVRDLRFKNFMDSAEKQGIGSQRALDIWKERNENPEKYSGYDANNNITLIPEMGVAAKQDYEQDLARIHQIAGETQKEIANKGYHFENGPNGKVLVDKTGSTVTSTNWEQLQELEKGHKAKWLDPNGEGYKYAQDAGLNITKDRIESDIRGMKDLSILDKTGQQTQFIKDPNEGNGSGKDPKEDDNILYEDTQEVTDTDFSKNSFEGNRTLRKKLENTSPNDPDYKKNIAKARQLDFYLEKVNTIFNKDPQNLKLQQSIQPKLNKIIETIKKDHPDDYDWRIDAILNNGNTPAAFDFKAAKSKDFREIEGTLNKINKIKDNLTKAQKIEYTGYVVDKTKDKGDFWKRHSQQTAELISSEGVVGNKYSIDSYYTTSVSDGKRSKPVNSETSSQLFSALQAAAKSGNVTIDKQYIEGEGGLPMIEFSFTPVDDMKLSGTGIGNNLKKDVPVTMRVNLNNFDGKKTDAVQNLFISSLESQGGVKGQAAAETMRNKARYNHIKANAKYYDFSQSDDIKEVADYFKELDVPLVNLHRNTTTDKFQYFISSHRGDKKSNNKGQSKSILWKDVFPAEAINDNNTINKIPRRLIEKMQNYFLSDNDNGITKQNINQLSDTQLDQVLINFINSKGNLPIEFDSKEDALLSFKK